MSSRRRALVTPALVLLLGCLTACGGGAPADVDAAPASAPASAPDAQSPTPTGPATLTAADFVRTVHDAQVAAQSYEFSLAVGSGDELVAMSGSAHLGDDPSLEMTMLAPGMPAMILRSTGGMGYVSLGELTGGKFVVVDPQDTSHPMAAAFAQALDQASPLMVLEQHADAVTGVTAVGEPFELDGVQVQAYEVEVELAKMPEVASRVAADLPPGAELPATITYSFVVDTTGLPRQVTFEVLGAPARMSLSGWGVAAPVTAPTADEITTEDPFIS